MKYVIQGKEIEIETSDSVFKPSPHGSSALGSMIKINPNDEVLDIGTGTGILAILSAKLGGSVSATDILPQAIDLAELNAKKNNVSIDFKIGDLFEPFNGRKFDVIIANVPQENLSLKVIESMSKEAVIGMHGGKNGNEILLNTLKIAANYMHKDSRMYVVVYSMSNFRESLKVILEKYQAELLNFYTGAVKDFLYFDLEWYLEQSNEGKISIYKNGSEYWADLFVFTLRI